MIAPRRPVVVASPFLTSIRSPAVDTSAPAASSSPSSVLVPTPSKPSAPSSIQSDAARHTALPTTTAAVAPAVAATLLPQVVLGRGRALFAWTGDQPGDLSLRQGEPIDILKFDDDGWWYGRLTNGREGVFPHNFCALDGDRAGKGQPTDEQKHEPARKPEVNLLNGDLGGSASTTRPSIVLAPHSTMGMPADHGSSAVVGGSTTSFLLPTDVPQEIPLTPMDSSSSNFQGDSAADHDRNNAIVAKAKVVNKNAKAIFSFIADSETELSFEEGQELMVVSDSGEGWLFGHVVGAPDSQWGVFPAAYCVYTDP
jgi:hypothetical protein